VLHKHTTTAEKSEQNAIYTIKLKKKKKERFLNIVRNVFYFSQLLSRARSASLRIRYYASQTSGGLSLLPPLFSSFVFMLYIDGLSRIIGDSKDLTGS